METVRAVRGRGRERHGLVWWTVSRGRRVLAVRGQGKDDVRQLRGFNRYVLVEDIEHRVVVVFVFVVVVEIKELLYGLK
jgi:hypothetical protein